MGAPERTVERELGRISRFGWGSRLLAKQDLEGTWAGSRRTAARRPLLAKVDFARTGEIIKPVFTQFSFPPRRRLAGAIDIVLHSQRADGRWTPQNHYRGKTYFGTRGLGAAIRWNTLRALRVLKWLERSVAREDEGTLGAG